jgi:hypothetical protein
MADEPQTNQPIVLRAINWREVFPFTNIFRAFRVAVHPSKLVLGLLALLVVYGAGRIMDAVWSQKSSANYGEAYLAESIAASKQGRTPPPNFDWVRDSQKRVYGSILTALNDRDKDLDAAAKKHTDDVAAAGGDGTKQQAAHKAYNEAVIGILSRFHQVMVAAEEALEAQKDLKGAPRGGLPAPSDASKIEADTFARASESKHRIALGRDRALEAIDSQYTIDKAAADAEPDADKKKQKQRDVEEARENRRTGLFENTRLQHHVIEIAVPRGLFATFLDYEVTQINNIVASVMDMKFGMTNGVIRYVLNFFMVGPGWFFGYHTLYAILFFVIFLLVWAVFGGAIARIAAVQVARDEKISVRQALRFSINKVLSFAFAPIIPLIIVLVIGLLLAVGGLLYYIPWIGPILAGALFFLALIAGVVITLVLLGTAGGLSLMFPTIAVEGSDSFDAISRSFSYVFARPWRMLFYTLVAIIYGALTYLFVRLFIVLVLSSTRYFVSWFLGGQPGRWFPEIWPESTMAKLPYDINFAGLKFTEDVSAFLICIWVFLLIGLLGAFVISFYFSANTIIYFLMRREVDATELEDVYVEDAEDDIVEPAAPVAAAAGVGTTPATMVSTTPVVPPYTPPPETPPTNPA